MKTWDEFKHEFFASLKKIADLSILQSAAVFIVGLGAIGSFVAESLARLGIGNLTVWDFDHVEVRNLPRSVYTTYENGLRKTNATKEHIKSINPLINVLDFDGDILNAPDRLIINIGKLHHVAVIAADDFKVHMKLNTLLYPITQCIYTYVTEDGDSGEIIRTTPSFRGCVRCLSNFEERKEAGIDRNFQALGIDMYRIALEATYTILGTLLKNSKGGDIFEQYLKLSSRLTMVISQRSVFKDALPSDFLAGTVQVNTSKLPHSCPICAKK